MENELFKLWPTLILKKTFNDHKTHKSDLLEFIKFYKEKYPSGREASENKNLYESNYDITNFVQDNGSLYSLIEFIGEGFKAVAYNANKESWKNQKIDANAIRAKITSMWFIDYLKDGFVFPHIHSNASWSMVYYLDLGNSNDEDLSTSGTHFMSPYNKSDSSDYGNFFSREASRNIIGKEGDALFFPSTLIHSSYPSLGKKRIIFSANCFFEKVE